MEKIRFACICDRFLRILSEDGSNFTIDLQKISIFYGRPEKELADIRFVCDKEIVFWNAISVGFNMSDIRTIAKKRL